jgi:hypothetical protein
MRIHEKRANLLLWFARRNFNPMKALAAYYPTLTKDERKEAKTWLFGVVEDNEGEKIWLRLKKKIVRNEQKAKK